MGFISFNEIGVSKSGKTKIFSVSSNGLNLGLIQFYGKWRKYCFFPNSYTLFDNTCLNEVSGFIKNETDKIFKR